MAMSSTASSWFFYQANDEGRRSFSGFLWGIGFIAPYFVIFWLLAYELGINESPIKNDLESGFSPTQGSAGCNQRELPGACHRINELKSEGMLPNDFESFVDVLGRSETDKKNHNYGPMYAEYFDVIRYHQVAFLEIGLREGASLDLWKAYFPRRKVYGIDKGEINKGFFSHVGEDNVTIFVGDQEDVPFLQNVLAKVKEEVGELDWVIDDGGHTMKQQITSFTTLFPIVKPGGYYFIEDLETSYYGEPCSYGCYSLCCGGGPPGTHGTTIALIKSLMDVLNEDFIPGPNIQQRWGINRYSVNPVDHMVGSVQCWRNMCAIRKKRKDSYF
eukprot:TRINITY_DN3568_c0_g2_i1.p1 TRINITY_DN3568_c0_g2~~TRINITY_DN3568_c0_g2_i1.p1  ORF type:complete len:330 (-),score=34.61 TRINITY_DN3568_c0_g2_i1:515-1504(-)